MVNRENKNIYLKNNLKSFMIKCRQVKDHVNQMMKYLKDYIIMVNLYNQQERKLPEPEVY